MALSTPKHIAFIMDGNRRFAKKNNQRISEGHKKGSETFKEVCKWCKELDIREVTVWGFSSKNFNRSQKEVEDMMALFREYLINLQKELNQKENKEVAINFIGLLDKFPKDIEEKMLHIQNQTKKNEKYTLNICVAYEGREELTATVQHIVKKVEHKQLKAQDITQELILENLFLSSEPDLIIRTGEEKRTSGFLPWQATQSEWIFLDTLWPEFTKDEFIDCISEYKSRDKRLGK